MEKYYFYGSVLYPTKNRNEIPKGSIGLHVVEGENEETLMREFKLKHEKQNIYLVDIFGKSTKVPFNWYGKYK